MKEIDKNLKEYIEAEILPRYAAYDAAHRLDHINTVIGQSMLLARHYDVDPDMVYTVAAYHDLGVCRGRELHHIYSGEMLAADLTLRRWFNEEQIETMRQAVEDHRASSDHTPRSNYGMIVAEADRQIDATTVMRRTVQYGLANYPQLDREGHFVRFCRHLTEKYGRGGYLKLYSPYSQNAARLEELRRIIDSPEQLRSRFDKIFDNESKRQTNTLS